MTIDISWPGKPRGFEISVSNEMGQRQEQFVNVGA
jgi:hypothetical protein